MQLLSDLQMLSGIQFENLCQHLLQEAGFSVETTSVSGDGGIDLIATCDVPFFAGKYIIQCKRYAESVGVSIIRDLYGVVTAERANKGILITTGHFTTSALEFAANLNLELISGDSLIALLHKYDLLSQSDATSQSNFLQNPAFDSDKYTFYKNMITQGLCTEEMGKEFILNILFAYLCGNNGNSTEDALSIIHCGLSAEYVKLFDWYINKYYKKGKEHLELLPHYIRKYRGLAQLYNFNIFDYVQARYDLLKSSVPVKVKTHVQPDGTVYEYRPAYYPISSLTEGQRSAILENISNPVFAIFPARYYELLNLLSLFSYFDFDKGVSLVNSLLSGNRSEIQEWLRQIPEYKRAIENFCIMLPKISSIGTRTRSGNWKFDEVRTKYDKTINMYLYYRKYRLENPLHMAQEKQKIRELLSVF